MKFRASAESVCRGLTLSCVYPSIYNSSLFWIWCQATLSRTRLSRHIAQIHNSALLATRSIKDLSILCCIRTWKVYRLTISRFIWKGSVFCCFLTDQIEFNCLYNLPRSNGTRLFGSLYLTSRSLSLPIAVCDFTRLISELLIPRSLSLQSCIPQCLTHSTAVQLVRWRSPLCNIASNLVLALSVRRFGSV